MSKPPAAIYKADTWHVDDGVSTDGSGLQLHHNPARRVFTAEYKLAILAEGVHAFPHDAAGTIELKDAEVALHGRSYANRAVFEDLSLGYPRPIQDLLNIGAENRAHSRGRGTLRRCSRASPTRHVGF